jgi:ribosomal protein S8
MQLQLNVNDLKANIFLELLDVFKKDNLIKDYQILKTYNDDEQQILDDLKKLKIDLKSSGHKTDKFIQLNDVQ